MLVPNCTERVNVVTIAIKFCYIVYAKFGCRIRSTNIQFSEITLLVDLDFYIMAIFSYITMISELHLFIFRTVMAPAYP